MRFRQFILSPQRIGESVYAWLKRETERMFAVSYTNAQSLGINSVIVSTNSGLSLPFYKEQRFIFNKTFNNESFVLSGEFTTNTFLTFYTKGLGSLIIENNTYPFVDNAQLNFFVSGIKPLTLIKL